MVHVTPRLRNPREGDPVPTAQEAWWAPGPVRTGAENLAHPPTGFEPRTVQPLANRYTGRQKQRGWIRKTEK